MREVLVGNEQGTFRGVDVLDDVLVAAILETVHDGCAVAGFKLPYPLAPFLCHGARAVVYRQREQEGSLVRRLSLERTKRLEHAKSIIIPDKGYREGEIRDTEKPRLYGLARCAAVVGLWHRLLIGLNRLVAESGLLDLFYYELSVRGVFLSQSSVFLLNVFLVQGETSDAGGRVYAFLLEVLTQLVGIVVAAVQEPCLRLDVDRVELLYLREIHCRIVERRREAEKISFCRSIGSPEAKTRKGHDKG